MGKTASWYEEKVRKIKDDNVRVNRVRFTNSIMDEHYAEPYRQDPPIANEKSNILMRYELDRDGNIPYKVLFQLYGLN